jgi:hypothetical protein
VAQQQQQVAVRRGQPGDARPRLWPLHADVVCQGPLHAEVPGQRRRLRQLQRPRCGTSAVGRLLNIGRNPTIDLDRRNPGSAPRQCDSLSAGGCSFDNRPHLYRRPMLARGSDSRQFSSACLMNALRSPLHRLCNDGRQNADRRHFRASECRQATHQGVRMPPGELRWVRRVWVALGWHHCSGTLVASLGWHHSSLGWHHC